MLSGGIAAALVAQFLVSCRGELRTSPTAAPSPGARDVELFDRPDDGHGSEGYGHEGDRSEGEGDDGTSSDEHPLCSLIRAEVDARRTPAQREEAKTAAEALRRESRHRVPLADLVAFMRPVSGQGAPTDAPQAVHRDQQIAMLLCDPITRQWVTRNYLASNSNARRGRP
jgi:hypothetical protein